MKQQLIDEIKTQLDQEGVLLSSIVRKAARLAQICGEHEYCLLFDLHLNGFDTDNPNVQVQEWLAKNVQVQEWTDKNAKPKWDFITAFRDDRTAYQNRFLFQPLEEMELRVETMRTMLTENHDLKTNLQTQADKALARLE